MYPAALTGTYAEASDQGSQSAAGALIPQRALVSSRGTQPPRSHSYRVARRSLPRIRRTKNVDAVVANPPVGCPRPPAGGKHS